VLQLEHEQIKALEDCDESTDLLGLAHIRWDGPFSVRVVGSVCEFFGIEELGELTQEVLEFARKRWNPRPRVRGQQADQHKPVLLRRTAALALGVLVERAYALSGRLHQTPKFSLIHG
jgi:hypothetical protein